MKKILAVLIALTMLLGVSALAEETHTCSSRT